jgi:hypothetical protein
VLDFRACEKKSEKIEGTNALIIRRSLVGPVVIDIKLGKKNQNSIPLNCGREEAETTSAESNQVVQWTGYRW